VINQINSQQEWEGSGAGALMGGIAGAGTGAVIDSDNRLRGGVIGGAAGAGVGYLMFGEDRTAWAFSVTVTQATSQVERDLSATKQDGTSHGSGVSGLAGASAGSQGTGAVDTMKLSFKSGLYTYHWACTVGVDAGSFHSRSGNEEAARTKLVERLPAARLGGEEIQWGQ
jgi:hypothetical protein